MSFAVQSNAVQKIFTLLGVIICCYLVNVYSQIAVISNHLPVVNSYFGRKFERHFWQFVFGFSAILFLSRGHLWSFGINSKNLKQSMKWLAWLYAAIILAFIATRTFKIELLPISNNDVPVKTGDIIMAMLVYWMSSPIANQILFFGFTQTLLSKQFDMTATLAGIPIVVYITTILFSFFGTDSSFALGSFSHLSTFAVGIFCGVVYWKTSSLITPMLAHAFVFGFPLAVALFTSRIMQ
jgi:membrane protease YdiL (CAAX protease family)